MFCLIRNVHVIYIPNVCILFYIISNKKTALATLGVGVLSYCCVMLTDEWLVNAWLNALF